MRRVAIVIDESEESFLPVAPIRPPNLAIDAVFASLFVCSCRSKRGGEMFNACFRLLSVGKREWDGRVYAYFLVIDPKILILDDRLVLIKTVEHF